MTTTTKRSQCSAVLSVKMLKRDFPVLIFSLIILVSFFVFMHAFRASIAIQEEIKSRNTSSVLQLNNSRDEVFLGDELFGKEFHRHKLAEPEDSRELKELIAASVLGTRDSISIRDEITSRDKSAIQPLNSNVHADLAMANDSSEMKELIAGPTLGERLKKMLNCLDRPLTLEKLKYDSYWLLRNYVRGTISRSIRCADTLTLTTNGDYTFFDNLAFLVERWLAPISFAIFAPGYDFNATLSCIQYVRNCLPESQHIRDYVTFHIYFPSIHMPKCIPLTEEDALLWPYNCDASPPYTNVNRTAMYKTVHNMTYPINVGRNIARKAANTHFILASDIELNPTPNLPRLFLEMVERNRSVYLDAKGNRVYTLPVFEVTEDSLVPENKTQLIAMLHHKKAIAFHSNICNNCHLVPKQKQWENVSDAQELNVFSSSKREGKFVSWEPFYISDNQEPMFDERVTWEGQSNKRIQGFAMCLLNYNYFVLHPAFLVHTPGIKYFDKNATRLKYVPAMNKLIKKVIEPEYRILYGTNKRCRT